MVCKSDPRVLHPNSINAKGRFDGRKSMKMVRAPGVKMAALRASYGLPPGPASHGAKKFDWRMVKRLATLIGEGLTLPAACGRAGVSLATIKNWQDAYPLVNETLENAKLARLARLEEDLLKSDAKMPQVVSRIFALKNANPDLWSENPGEQKGVPGLQANITVITGVPDAPVPTIEHQQPPNEPIPDDRTTVIEAIPDDKAQTAQSRSD